MKILHFESALDLKGFEYDPEKANTISNQDT
jgi:hypothetical protein